MSKIKLRATHRAVIGAMLAASAVAAVTTQGQPSQPAPRHAAVASPARVVPAVARETGTAASPAAYVRAAHRATARGYVRHGAHGRVTARGILEVSEGTIGAADHGGDQTRYALRTADGSVDLDAASVTRSTSDALTSGTEVKLSGTASASGKTTVSTLAVVGQLPGLGLGPLASTPAQPVRRKVLVYRFTWPGESAPSYAAAEKASLEAAFKLTPTWNSPSLPDFYAANSRGSFLVSGEVRDYVQLPAVNADGQSLARPRSGPCYDSTGADVYDRGIEAAKRMAQASGDVQKYDVVALWFPADPQCKRSQGEILGRYMYFGGHEYEDGQSDAPIYDLIHEYGHTLGLGHAGFRGCRNGALPVVLSNDCVTREYEDYSDNMGAPDVYLHFSAFEKARLGLLPLSSTQTITPAASGTPDLELAAHDTAAAPTSPQLLRIRRATAAPDPRDSDAYLYLDLRTAASDWGPVGPSALDPRRELRANDPAINGVGARLGSSYGARFGQGRVLNSSPGRIGLGLLHDALDPTPTDFGNSRRELKDPSGRTTAAGQQDFSIAPQQSIWDPVENFTVTVNSVASGKARVAVTAGPPAATTTVSRDSSGRLVIAAVTDPWRNNVVIARRPGAVVVGDLSTSVQPGTGCTAVNAQIVTCPSAALTSVSVNVKGGDDLAAVVGDFTLPVSFDGGAGRDVLEGGPEDDSFDGGPGPTTANPTGDADIIHGGFGSDTVSYASRTAAVRVTASPNDFADGQVLASGGSEGDNIDLDTDWVIADGAEGPKTTVSDTSIDRVIGGSGNDDLQLPGNGPVRLTGGPGADRLLGSDSKDDELLAADGAADQLIDCAGARGFAQRDASDPSSPTCDTALAITSGPEAGSRTASLRPVFTFVGPAGVTYTCKFEKYYEQGSATAVPCSGSFTTATPLNPDSPYRFVLQASNGVKLEPWFGTTDGQQAPDTTVTADTSVAGVTNAFRLAATGGTAAGFQCSLDNGAYEPCTSPVRFLGLPPGSHTLAVRSVAATGEVDPTPATTTWALPYETVVREIANTDATSYVFTSPGATDATFECRVLHNPNWQVPLPGNVTGGWVPCTSPFRATVTTGPAAVSGADGAGVALRGGQWYRVEARAGGPSGAVDPTPTTSDLNNNSPHGVVIDTPSADGTTTDDPKPTFTFHAPPGDGGYSVFSRQLGFECAVVAPSPTPPSPANFKDCSTPSDPQDSARATSGSYTAPNGLTGTVKFWVRATVSGLGRQLDGTIAKDYTERDANIASRTIMITPRVLRVGAPDTVPAAVNLTGTPAFADWVHFKSTTSASVDRAAVSPATIGNWSKYGTATVSTVTGPTTFSWSNATGTASGSSAIGMQVGATGATANGHGFSFNVAASPSETRTLTLWVGVRGSTAPTTGTLTVGYPQESPQQPASVSVSAAAGATVVRRLTVTYRPPTNASVLKVDWQKTVGGTTAGTAVQLFAAAVG